MKVLITGASGNVGYEIIRGLRQINSGHDIIAADFDIEIARSVLSEFENLQYRCLNFSDSSTFDKVLSGIDIVFLLRPPQLADINKYFSPFIGKMKVHRISKVVFLSVQGVERQKMIPHYKIEKLIMENSFEYIFLRPGYFMQNLTSMFLDEIRNENKIFIPAGKLKFNWVDARDIGLCGAIILNDFNQFKSKSYELTSDESMGFDKVCVLIGSVTGKEIRYESPNLLKFYFHKRKMGLKTSLIMVMIMLHWLPRFSKNLPQLTDSVLKISGSEPTTLIKFIEREKGKFLVS